MKRGGALNQGFTNFPGHYKSHWVLVKTQIPGPCASPTESGSPGQGTLQSVVWHVSPQDSHDQTSLRNPELNAPQDLFFWNSVPLPWLHGIMKGVITNTIAWTRHPVETGMCNWSFCVYPELSHYL